MITDSTATGLIPWSHVLKLEALNSGELSLRDIVCPISEILFYGLDTTEFGTRSHWLKKAKTSLNKRLADIPDANQRRSMRAKLFKHGKFTPFARQLLRQQQAAFIDTNSDALPELTLPEFRPLFEEGGMYDFLSGKVSEQKYRETFMKTAGNPIVLANLIAYPELAIMDVSKYLWNETSRLTERVSTLVRGLVQIQTLSGPVPFKRLNAELAKVFKSTSSRIELASALTGHIVSDEMLSKMQATSLFVDSIGQYVMDKVGTYANTASPNFASEIKFERSDFADLTHIVYAPYVHIFGCDGATRDRVRKAGYPIKSLATSDAELAQKLHEARTGHKKDADG